MIFKLDDPNLIRDHEHDGFPGSCYDPWPEPCKKCGRSIDEHRYTAFTWPMPSASAVD